MSNGNEITFLLFENDVTTQWDLLLLLGLESTSGAGKVFVVFFCFTNTWGGWLGALGVAGGYGGGRIACKKLSTKQ